MQRYPLPAASDSSWHLTQRVLDGTYTINNPKGWTALVESAHAQEYQLASHESQLASLRAQLSNVESKSSTLGTVALVEAFGLVLVLLLAWRWKRAPRA